MPEIIGDNIDRLCSVEIRPRANLPRGVTGTLYQAARRAQGDRPLSCLAAAALQGRVRPGDHVLFVTGAGGPPYVPHGETDGPLGAVGLARALSHTLHARPIFVLESHHVPPVAAAALAAGMNDAPLVQFPHGDGAGREAACGLIDRYHPAAVVFIEKLSPNLLGVVHSVMGRARDPEVIGAAHWLASEAQKQEVLTIGIGDGGNEIGFGMIADVVREIQPYGNICQCPCRGGIAAAVSTDVVVAAAISNWGAYGVAACLAYQAGAPEALPDEAMETRMLAAAVEAGGVDAVYGRRMPSVDGVQQDAQLGFLHLLRAIVTNGLVSLERPF
jgi:hypothetical protein